MYTGKPFVEELTIENFRCFPTPRTVTFAVPNGAIGSGLTLFVGNNGTGKTSVLEALDYLFGGRYKGESRLKIGDFSDFEKKISISGRTDRFSVGSSLEYYKGKYFNCIGVNFTAQPRDRKQPGKLLSAPISAKSMFSLDENAYYNVGDHEAYIQKKSGDSKPVDPRELTLDNGKAGPNGIDVFYFDKNRARHLASGTYRTTFDAICEDLNWKFQKKLRNEGNPSDYASKVSNELFSWAMELAQKGTGERLGNDFSEFFGNETFKNIRFELLSLLEPFSSAFLAIRKEGDVHQISTRSLGSGVELVLALLLQRLLSESAKGDKIYLIDEPEMHLHPTAQKKLADLLLEEAKESQVIVSSHSPYMLQSLVSSGLTNVFTTSADGKIKVEPQGKTTGYFPWSPSFGEVNLKAFSMPTIEFHNELYGFIQESENLRTCPQMDAFLLSKGVPQDHTWINAKTGSTEAVSLCTYVRHCIHHPENKQNKGYDEVALAASTKLLIDVLEARQSGSVHSSSSP